MFIDLGSTGRMPLNFEVCTPDYNYAANQTTGSWQLSTSFMADAYDFGTYQNLLKGNNHAYLSPYYAPK